MEFVKLELNLLTTGNFRIWVLLQVGIKNCVTYLITHFICKERCMKTGVTYNLKITPYAQICNVLPAKKKKLRTIFDVIYALVWPREFKAIYLGIGSVIGNAMVTC